MEKGKYVADLRPGSPVPPSVFLATQISIRSADAKGPRVTMKVADRTGVRLAKLWNVSETQIAALTRREGGALFLRISGDVDADERYSGEVTIRSLEDVRELPGDLTPFLAGPRPHHRDDWKRLCALVAAIGDPHLRQLLRVPFPKSQQEKFRGAAAAQSVHHAYKGGLLRHTVEVAEMCRSAGTLWPDLKHDLLVAAALLHDYGKLWSWHSEMAGGERTNRDFLIGHIHEGAYQVRRRIEDIDGFPKGLALALEHLILSHHALPEHGSPQVPQFGEAWVLTLCDQMSANVDQYRERTAEMRRTGQRQARILDRVCFAGDLGLDDLDLSGAGAAFDPSEDVFAEPSDATELAGRIARLPLLGWVAAGDGDQGSSVGDLASAEEWHEVLMPPGGADFLLRVTGDSMTGAGILEGDLLYIRRLHADPRPGDIVIATVPASLSHAGGLVKRFDIAADGTPALVSENPLYAPIPFTAETCVQGRVVHLTRELISTRAAA